MYPFNSGFDSLDENDVRKMADASQYTQTRQASRVPAQRQRGNNTRPVVNLNPSARPSNGQSGPGSIPTPPGWNNSNNRPGNTPAPGLGFQPGYPSQPGKTPQQPNTPPSGGSMNKPTAPPPDTAPTRPARSTSGVQTLSVDSGSIRGCMYHNTYVWLRNGVDFWFYPVYVGRNSVSGFRWTRFGWAYTGIDLSWIDFFQCV
jgi:hypothetical protein